MKKKQSAKREGGDVARVAAGAAAAASTKRTLKNLGAARRSAAESARRQGEAVRAAQNTAREIERVAQKYRNCTLEQVAGRTAEAFYAGTYSMDAAAKGIGVVARTTESVGRHHAA